MERLDLERALAHPALERELEFGSLLRGPERLKLQREAEQRQLGQLLEQGAWGLCDATGFTLVRPLPFDSEHFGHLCADLCRVALLPDLSAEEVQPLLDRTLEEATARKIRLLSARPRAELGSAVQHLLGQGMLLVDTSVAIGTTCFSATPVPSRTIRSPRSGDEAALEAIAATFVENRFHRDPRIPEERATALYRSWGRAAARGQLGQLLLAEVEGKVAGFCSYRTPLPELSLGQIGLIVIAPEHRGQGLSQPLLSHCALATGCQAICSSTQVTNAAALRAFARLGLLPFSTRQILHGWLD